MNVILSTILHFTEGFSYFGLQIFTGRIQKDACGDFLIGGITSVLG